MEANEAYQRLLGYHREELIGRNALGLHIFANLAARDELLSKLDERGAMRDYEVIVRTKSNDLRTLLLSSEALDLDGEACVLALGIDITERRRAEEALRDSQQLMDLSVRLVNAQENERRTLAYELHDEIGQHLTGLNMALESCAAFRARSAGDCGY